LFSFLDFKASAVGVGVVVLAAMEQVAEVMLTARHKTTKGTVLL
jgi:hypothetical protein